MIDTVHFHIFGGAKHSLRVLGEIPRRLLLISPLAVLCSPMPQLLSEASRSLSACCLSLPLRSAPDSQIFGGSSEGARTAFVEPMLPSCPSEVRPASQPASPHHQARPP